VRAFLAASDGLIGPTRRDRIPQRRAGDFLSLRRSHSSQDKKISSPASFAVLQPQAVRFDRSSAKLSPSRPRWARPDVREGETIMAIIGNFTKLENGYTGSIKTAAVSVKAKITPAVKENDKAPDFRVFTGQSEFGAAWKRTSSAGREYLSVKLDDPSFPAPVFATLVDTEDDGSVLIWSRRDVE
jgi:uncharacterized protein (DUF736 family)